MASLQDVRYGLDARLATIQGLNHSHTAPDSITAPFAYVSLPGGPNAPVVRYDETFGNGTACWNLHVVLCIAKVDAGIAQDSLDPYLSNDAANLESIFQAIMADIHLTYQGVATASSTRVKGAHSYGIHKVGSTDYLGVIFEIEVISSP